MNVKVVVVSLILSGALLGCEQASKAPVLPANWLSIPTLPIIQDAVLPLAPTFNGQRDGGLSQQVCALANGQASQDQVNEQLRRRNIDPSRLSSNASDAVALLVNGNSTAQKIACAAYLATEVMRPVDLREFSSTAAKPVAEQAAEEGKKHTRAPVAAENRTAQIDAGRLALTLPYRVAQARANADVFALIAEQLQRTPGLGIQQYREQARDLFIRLAPTYLERVRLQMPPSNASYQVLQLDGRHLVFGNTVGTRFDYSVDNGLVLTQNGLTWYGNGRLLGTLYKLRAAYFPAEVTKVLARGGSR